MKKLLLCTAALIGGCTATDYGNINTRALDKRDFKSDPSKTFAHVKFSSVIARPTAYKSMNISFDCIFDKRDENVWVPAYTTFAQETHLSFSAWPEEARLWVLEERKKSLPTLYMPKLCNSIPNLVALQQYSVFNVKGTVKSVFSDIPFIEVDEVTLVTGPNYTPASLKQLIAGFKHLQDGNLEDALSLLKSALKTVKAPQAILDVSLAIASILHQAKDFKGALEYYEAAYKIDPRDDIKKSMEEMRKLLGIESKIEKLNKKEDQDKDKKINELENQLREKDERLKQMNNEVENKTKQIRADLNEKQKQLDQALNNCKDLQEKTANLSKKLSEAEDKLKSKTPEEKDKKIDNLEKEKKALLDQIKKKDAETKELIEKKDTELKEQIKKKDVEIQKLHGDNKGLSEKVTDLTKKLKEADDTIAKLSKSPEEKDKTITGLQKEKKDLQNKLAEREGAIDKLKNESNQLQKKNGDLSSENEKLKSERGNVEKTIRANYEKTIADLNKTVVALRGEVDKLMKEKLSNLEK